MRSVASASVALLIVLLGPSAAGRRAPDLRPSKAAAQSAGNPFGMATSGEAASQYATFLPKLSEIGVGSVRMFGEWSSLEPKEGSFDFSYEDRRVAAVRRAGMEPTGLLLYSSRWALPEGTTHAKTFPLSRLDAYGRFVAKLTDRYRESIRYWEIWNEPNALAFNQGKHGATDYAKLVATAYKSAKKAFPGVQLGIGCANFDLPYLRLVIKELAAQNAADAFDFIAVHPYELLDAVGSDNGEPAFLAMVGNVRKMLAEVAPKRKTAPVRFTEIGAREKVGSDPGVEPNVAAQLLVKAYTMALAQGVDHVQWFEAKDAGASRGFGLLTDDMKPRPAFTALGSLTQALGTNPVYQGWLPLGEGGDGYGFVFVADGENVLVAWMPKGRSASLRFDSTLTVIDIYNQRSRELPASSALTLGEKPAILMGLSSRLVRTAVANRKNAYPWGSSPVNSRLATLTLGPRNDERGLTQFRRADTIAATFSDGSTGVKVNVGRGNTLPIGINPTFADYGTREVWVRVTARTTEPVKPGVNCGMNLWYQSTSGVAKGAPPYPYTNANVWWTVPPDQKWHAKVWRLTDAMFVNTFGFSLYLKFDASPTFVVGKVEISKVPFD